MTGDPHRGPLDGCRVVVTREERGRLGELLADRGADVVHVPLIEVVDAPGDALPRALERLVDHEWLVVTSGQGADRVGDAARATPTVRLAAVGAVTAERLAERAGRSVDLVPRRQLAAELVAEFESIAPTTVFVAHADRATATLVDGLRRQGHAVTEVTAYVTRTRPPTSDEIAQILRCDAVLFTSGSAAASWSEAFDDRAVDPLRAASEDRPHIVAIGPTTDSAIRQIGLKSDAVAADHSLHGLVDALIRLWSDSGRRPPAE